RPVAQGDYAVRGRGDALVVGDHDQGLSRATQLGEEPQDVEGGRAVEVPGGFVRTPAPPCARPPTRSWPAVSGRGDRRWSRTPASPRGRSCWSPPATCMICGWPRARPPASFAAITRSWTR